MDTAALNRLLVARVAMRDGNFRKRLTVSGDGVMSEIAAVFNEVADRNLHLTGELARVRRVVGREGKLTERLEVGAQRAPGPRPSTPRMPWWTTSYGPSPKWDGCCRRSPRAISNSGWIALAQFGQLFGAPSAG